MQLKKKKKGAEAPFFYGKSGALKSKSKNSVLPARINKKLFSPTVQLSLESFLCCMKYN